MTWNAVNPRLFLDRNQDLPKFYASELGMVKRKAKPIEPDEEEVYTVEVLLAAKVVEPDPEDSPPAKKRKRSKGKKDRDTPLTPQWRYLVKWAGYPRSEATWEPPENLGSTCEPLLQSFWKAVGIDNEDYDVGAEFKASDKWIEKEIKRFQKDLKKEQKKKMKKENEPYSKSLEAEERDDTPEEPPSYHTSSKKKKVIKANKSRGATSESEDSEPLRKAKTQKKIKVKRESTSTAGSSKDPTPSTNVTAPPPPLPKPRQKIAPLVQSSPKGTPLFSDEEEPASPQVPLPQPSQAPLPTPSQPPLPTPSLPVRKAQPNTSGQSTTARPTLPVRKASVVLPESQPPNAASSSGISVKRRLADSALEPLPPKLAKLSHPNKGTSTSKVMTGSTSIMPTNFRKNVSVAVPTSGLSTVRHSQDITLASLNSKDSPPPDSPENDSRKEPYNPYAHVGQANDDFFSQEDNLGFGNSMNMEPVATSAMTAAERFLESAIPESLAAPYSAHEEMAAAKAPISSKPRPTKSPAENSSVQRSWSGVLKMGASRDGTISTDFSVVIDREEQLSTEASLFKLSLVLNSIKELQVTSLYEMSDVKPLFKACRPPAYRATISCSSSEESERRPWLILINYMARKQRVAIVPLHMDGNLIGHILVHPSSRNPLPGILPPVGQSRAETFTAIFLPWSLTPAQVASQTHGAQEDYDDPLFKKTFDTFQRNYDGVKKRRLASSPSNANPWESLVKTRPTFQLALRHLGFPDSIYTYLTQTTRGWAIVDASGREYLQIADLESHLLLSIMQQIKKETKKPKNPQDAKTDRFTQLSLSGVVFIHLGALRHLDALPGFRARFQSSSYVRFYAYGSHPSYPSTFWGVKEIFPIGGVVTFTPSAFLSNPLVALDKLREIHAHPRWVAYVMPVVIGMVAALCKCESIDTFPFPYLLRAISRGEIAMLQAPPERKDQFGAHDQRQAWLRQQIHAGPLSEADALARGCAAFHSEFANLPEQRWDNKVEMEVLRDLRRMQYQPALVTSYRRFVVLTGSKDAQKRSGPVESMLPSQFEFRDGFSMSH